MGTNGFFEKIVEIIDDQYFLYIILICIIASYAYQLMTSSVIEKFMFHSKDKLAFKAINIIMMWLSSVVIIMTFGYLLRKTINNVDSISSFSIWVALYLFIMIVGASTSINLINNAVEWLNSKNYIKNILIAIILIIAFYPSIRSMATLYNMSEEFQSDVMFFSGLISARHIFNFIVACILSICALLLSWFMSKNIILPEKESLHIDLEGNKWYLIKFINKDILLGDESSEKSCLKFMLADRSILKDIVIQRENKEKNEKSKKEAEPISETIAVINPETVTKANKT